MADFSAGVSIECVDFQVGSITLSGHFSGPSPWRIRGHATVPILWWNIDVDIPELTMGKADAPPPPAARDPLAVLCDELQRPENWMASTRDMPPLVRLRPGADRDKNALHPMATATFRQSAVPLDIDLQRMDGVPLPAAVTLQVRPAAGQPIKMRDELFPPSQFREQDDKAKLSSSGYARFHGGFDVGEQGAQTGGVPQTRTITPETSVLGEDVFVPKQPLPLREGLRIQFGHHALHRVDLKPFLRLRDPGAAVVASVANLHDATGALTSGISAVAEMVDDRAMLAAAPSVAGASVHAGVAEQLIDRLGRFDSLAAADLQVVRAWETVSA